MERGQKELMPLPCLAHENLHTLSSHSRWLSGEDAKALENGTVLDRRGLGP